MKSAVVNNHALSLICIKNKLDCCLLSELPGLKEMCERVRNKIDYYIDHIDAYYDKKEDNINEVYVKITGDIVEALVGAVYLDSYQDLNVTMNVIKVLCHDVIVKFANDKYIQTDPEYIVKRYCEENQRPMPIIRYIMALISLRK